MGDPLSQRHVWRHRGKLAEQLDRADLGDAGDTYQQIVSLTYVVVASDQRHGVASQLEDTPLTCSECAFQVLDHATRRGDGSQSGIQSVLIPCMLHGQAFDMVADCAYL